MEWRFCLRLCGKYSISKKIIEAQMKEAAGMITEEDKDTIRCTYVGFCHVFPRGQNKMGYTRIELTSINFGDSS
ncbi:MAG: hypothetical protein EF813_06145 [Methanosarcinales archaeon]|nr:MAG: hypothetical protein EF813_06145 [Methanosarcinales archaeon]